MAEKLPFDREVWKSWRTEVERRIRSTEAETDLNCLIKEGCDRDSLLFRLVAVVAWQGRRIRWKDSGLTRHRVKEAPKKLRETADLIERLHVAMPLVVGDSAGPDVLVRSLRSCADEIALDALGLFRRKRITLWDAAVCSLVGYVKRTTRTYHDREVSGLLAAVLDEDSYSQTNLTQWRWKHARVLELMGSCLVTPVDIPVPDR